MKITYKNTHNFSKKELEDLFLSVELYCGEFSDKLVIAMRNFNTVYSAWDGEDLIGLICAMDDGIMNAYINYLLVKPEYQLKGVGKNLVEKIKIHYKDYKRIAVITPEIQSRFYEYCGFEKREDEVPLFLGEPE